MITSGSPLKLLNTPNGMSIGLAGWPHEGNKIC